MLDPGPCNWSGSSVSAFDSPDHKRRNMKGNRRKIKKFWFFRLQVRRAYDFDRPDFPFSLGRKRCYDLDSYDFHSAAIENQP